MNTRLRKSLDQATPEQLRAALSTLLDAALTPAFGALSKRELDLLLLGALIDTGFLVSSPELYDMMAALKITRGKARALLFDRDMRRLTPDQLDDMLRRVLEIPRVQSQGHTLVLEVDNPALLERARELVRRLGHTSDGSFSGSHIRLSEDAAVALISHLVPQETKDDVVKALASSGVITDTSFEGVVKGVLSTAAKKVAGDAGEAVADEVGSFLAGVFAGQAKKVVTIVKKASLAG